MTTTQTLTRQSSDGQLRPWQASVQARITRGVGVDQIEQIDYGAGGEFTQQIQTVGGPSFDHIVVLNDQERQQLMADLELELKSPPAGTDTVGLEVFVALLKDSLRSAPPPSNRFANARFGDVTRDESRGILFGHLGLGVDVTGTVRAARHVLTFEQHVVMLPPGQFRALSAADRASLAAALTAALPSLTPPADALWREILQDAQ